MTDTDDLLDRLSARAAAAGLDVSPALAAQLGVYYRLLVHWNTSINLTALKLDPIMDQSIDRLLIEPLTALRHLQLEAPVWFDLGSGGGSPAIPMKLARPDFRLTMVESRERKAAFLREAIRVLGLADASVEVGRIEAVAANRALSGSVDLITVRAVRVDPPLFDAMYSLLRLGGRVVLFGARHERLAVPDGFDPVVPPGAPQAQANNIVLLKRTGR